MWSIVGNEPSFFSAGRSVRVVKKIEGDNPFGYIKDFLYYHG
jgi:hypothetical protein